jgi:WD40 repeat protein
MVEFGLIPTQIMNKECAKRDKKESIRKGKEITDSTCDLKYYTCKNNENDSKVKYNTNNLNALKIGVFSSEKITLFYNNFIVAEKKVTFSSFEKNYSYDENITKQYKYNNKMSEFYNPEKYNGKAIQFCQKGKLLIIGGFYDGKVELLPIDDITKGVQIIPFKDKLPILSVASNKDEDFLFVGNSIGNVRLLKLDKDLNKSKLSQTITDHMSAISHIDCNSELNLWASASIDGYINIYTFPLSKLVRSIKVPTNKCDFVYLSSSPLPSIVAITEEKKIAEIFVYSINGKLLLRQKEQESISCPIIIKDLNKNDYLAYIMNDTIIIRSIPTLIRQVCIDGLKDIYAIYPNEDMKVLYGINKTGTEIYVIKDENKKI